MKRYSSHPVQLLVAAALALFLVACGGGGGGSGNNNPSVADKSPDAFGFSPAQIDAVAGGTYTATATVTGFDGELTARISNKEGNAGFSLESGSEGVDALSVSAGDALTLRTSIGGAAKMGHKATATITVGEGGDAKSATLKLIVVDKQAPDLSISFPTPWSTTHDETITLTGRWSDDGDEPVTLQFAHDDQQIDMPSHAVFPDGTWQINVALEPGRNDLSVDAVNSDGIHSSSQEITVMREASFVSSPTSVAFDQVENKMYVVGNGRVSSGDASPLVRQVVEIDLTTNRRRVVHSEGRDAAGNPTERLEPYLLLDIKKNRLLLVDSLDSENNRLIAIDISNGNVAELARGFKNVVAIETGPVTQDDKSIFVLGRLQGDANGLPLAVLKMTLGDTGSHTEVFSRPGQVGGGDGWTFPASMAYDKLRDFLYLVEVTEAEDLFSEGLFRIDVSGNRTLIDTSGFNPDDDPRGLAVDSATGTVYVLHGGTLDGQFNASLLKIEPNAPVAAYTIIRSNESDGTNPRDDMQQLVAPADLLLFQRDGETYFWMVDTASAKIVEIGLDDRNESVIPSRESDSGLAFDDPQTMTLDVANNRLLMLSPSGIQGVNIDTGHRNAHDLFVMPEGTSMGGMQIFGDDLWVTLNGNSRGLGTIARSELGAGDAPPPSVFNEVLNDPDRFENSTGIMVEKDFVIVGTRRTETVSENNRDSVYFVDRNDDHAATELFSTAHTGALRKHLLKLDGNLFIHGDLADIELIDVTDPGDPVVKNLLVPNVPGNISGVDTYAYDAARKRLYMAGGIDQDGETQFGWLDLSNLEGDLETLPVTEIARTVAGDNQVMPGYGTAINRLNGFALDAERERLYAFGKLPDADSGREVVAINLMAVAVDEDGEPGFDKDEDGNLVRKQTGETVLISRSNGSRISE